jgi:hypothetical protein
VNHAGRHRNDSLGRISWRASVSRFDSQRVVIPVPESKEHPLVAFTTTGFKVASILWFPLAFAVALPVIFQITFHTPHPHQVRIGVVGSGDQVAQVGRDLRQVSAGGFEVEQLSSETDAAAAVRDRQVAAAYVNPTRPNAALYVAMAASNIRANYLFGVFSHLPAHAGEPPPQIVDLVPLRRGDSGTGIFFFVFPMMMVGVITVIALQRAPWSVVQRAIAVAGIGFVGAATVFLTATSLNVVPRNLVLLAYALLLTQIFGQLSLGLGVLLGRYFLPVAMTFSLVLSVPSSGGTFSTDLLPTGLRYLSNVLPLAQGVKVVRSISYFHDGDLMTPTVILIIWTVIAFLTVGIAVGVESRRQRSVNSSAVTAHE